MHDKHSLNIASKRDNAFTLNFLIQLANYRCPFRVVLDNACPLTNQAVIFAANHSNTYDIPLILSIIERTPFVLMGKQRLTLIERIFFLLYGTV